MELRSDEVVFDLLVDNVENKEDDGGDRRAKEEEQGNEDTADDRAEHRDEIENHGDEAHWESEATGEAAGQRE